MVSFVDLLIQIIKVFFDYAKEKIEENVFL